jgi:2-polyprenyl-3-methyl-5-hydroxy-6-metoxy-1,4-benzoquinol methylase
MFHTLRWRIAQFFEIRWWQRYLASKDKAAYYDWKRRYWHSFLEKSQLQPTAGASILDIGCGPAGIFTIFEHDHHTDAVDPLLQEYEQKLPHFKRSDYPTVRFFTETIEQFQADRQYDWVFCLNAINHVADIHSGFDQLVRFVKPGGTLVVSVDAHNFSFLKTIFRAFPGDILHPHQYDLPEYENMLTQRGRTIQRTILIKKEHIFNYFVIVC